MGVGEANAPREYAREVAHHSRHLLQPVPESRPGYPADVRFLHRHGRGCAGQAVHDTYLAHYFTGAEYGEDHVDAVRLLDVHLDRPIYNYVHRLARLLHQHDVAVGRVSPAMELAVDPGQLLHI